MQVEIYLPYVRADSMLYCTNANYTWTTLLKDWKFTNWRLQSQPFQNYSQLFVASDVCTPTVLMSSQSSILMRILGHRKGNKYVQTFMLQWGSLLRQVHNYNYSFKSFCAVWVAILFVLLFPLTLLPPPIPQLMQSWSSCYVVWPETNLWNNH